MKMLQVLPPPPQQQQQQLQQQQLQLKLILFLEIGLLFNTADNTATLLIHFPSIYHHHLTVGSFQCLIPSLCFFLKLIFHLHMIIGHDQHMKAMIRTFAEYEEGFTVGGESWLGLKQLAELTKVVVKSLKKYDLKVCIDTTFGKSSIIH